MSAWTCTCKTQNDTEKLFCSKCGRRQLYPAARAIDWKVERQSFDEFCTEDLNERILPAFEFLEKTRPGTRLNVARACFYARALSGFLAAKKVEFDPLLVRWAAAFYQSGRLNDVERVVFVGSGDAKVPGRPWRRDSALHARAYMEGLPDKGAELAPKVEDLLLELAVKGAVPDSIEGRIVRDAYRLDRLRFDDHRKLKPDELVALDDKADRDALIAEVKQVIAASAAKEKDAKDMVALVKASLPAKNPKGDKPSWIRLALQEENERSFQRRLKADGLLDVMEVKDADMEAWFQKNFSHQNKGWDEVKKLYIPTTDLDAPRRMLKMQAFRARVVDGLLDKLINEQNTASPHLKFTSSGSTNPTSDYDVQLYDDGSLEGNVGDVIEKFNAKFRERYKLESGTALDTNVYDPSWRVPRDDAAENEEITASEQRIVRENDIEQDRGALAKVHKYMTSGWLSYCEQLTGAMKDEKRKAHMKAQLDAAAELIKDFEAVVKDYKDDARLRAMNLAYVKELQAVHAARKKQHDLNKELSELKKQKKPENELLPKRLELDLATRERRKAMVRATIFGHEAYHSEGPMIDVVYNQQESYKKVFEYPSPTWDWEHDRPQRRYGWGNRTERGRSELSPMEMLESLNEQFGDALKDIEHYGKKAADIPKVAVQTSKYVKRLFSIAKALKQELEPRERQLEAINGKDLLPLRAASSPPSKAVLDELAKIDITAPSDYVALLTALNVRVNANVRNSLPVVPGLTLHIESVRTRAVLEGWQKKPAPIKLELFIEGYLAAAVKYSLQRSSAAVKVFTDEKLEKELAFNGAVASLDGAAQAFTMRSRVPLWVLPPDGNPFWLELHADRTDPAKLEFGKALEFLDRTSRFLQLMDGFESVGEIVRSFKRIKSLAALADMKAEEFANFAIKRLFIRKGVLEQPVVVRIDDADVELRHPETGGRTPLRYSDFVIDRSGPKFLGALDADVAVEALMYKDACISTLLAKLHAEGKATSFHDSNLIAMVRDLSVRRFRELQKKHPRDYPDVTETEIDCATSVFEQKHMAQRKLSDFDLTARETRTLSRAIGNAVRPRVPQLPDELMYEIGRYAWAEGGPVELAKVRAAMEDKDPVAKYRELVKADERYVPKPAYNKTAYRKSKYHHMLIHEVGVKACALLEKSEPHVDCGYGLGIPYFGPEVREEGGGFVFQDHGDEIGDIITDETSHYGTVFSHEQNIQAALGGDLSPLDGAKNLRDNGRAILERRGDKAKLSAYRETEAFYDAILMFEQVAKKEAQAQLFKAKNNAGKLLGNVSDVSQFLYGADIAARVAKSAGKEDVVTRMEALKEVVSLSCLIAMPRWGINAKNLAQVGDTASAYNDKPQEFADSINERSYSHLGDMDSPRVHVEWAKIDKAIAKQRLQDYKTEMEPIWKFIREQKDWFAAMDALSAKINQPHAPELAAVKAELEKVLPKLKSLARVSEGRHEALVQELTLQAEESSKFLDTRLKAEAAAKK